MTKDLQARLDQYIQFIRSIEEKASALQELAQELKDVITDNEEMITDVHKLQARIDFNESFYVQVLDGCQIGKYKEHLDCMEVRDGLRAMIDLQAKCIEWNENYGC